jgi:hypothetical protein
VYFTLAVSAGTALQCTALVERALATDPRVMPVPGPAAVRWRSPDGRVALLHWGPEAGALAGGTTGSRAGGAGLAGGGRPSSRAGTIWVDPSDGLGAPVRARTSMARIDPVYVADGPDAVLLSDRAMWVAYVAGRLADHEPMHSSALVAGPGYPLGMVTPFAGVYALEGASVGEVLALRLQVWPAGREPEAWEPAGGGGAARVAAALVAAVEPLRASPEPVEVSLTGGRGSRMVLAALTAAGVPVRVGTHGFPTHPDVAVAARVAGRLGLEHVVRTPVGPDEKTDVVTRIRASVLVADGMLPAFENVGRPDPAPGPLVTAVGHGGELLRGGYAQAAGGGADLGSVGPARRAARAAEVLRRLTTRHVALLRPGVATRYLASLTPWSTAALAHGPVQALDDFYLANRAGRWAAAARQAFLLRGDLVQPLLGDDVVRAVRSVPLADRIARDLPEAVVSELCPELAGVPYAGKPAKGAAPEAFDWRRQYGDQVARFLRDYTLDLGATSSLFDVISQSSAERALALPHDDRGTVWALATMACLASGDFRNARDEAPVLSVS